MVNKTNSQTPIIQHKEYETETTYIIIIAVLQTCVTLTLLGVAWYKLCHRYHIHDSTFILQTFQNIYNFQLITNHIHARKIILQDFLNFIIGGWIYAKHITYLSKFIEENENKKTLIYDEAITNVIIQKTKQKIRMLQDITDQDKDRQFVQIALDLLNDYIIKHRTYNIVEVFVAQNAGLHAYNSYKQNEQYYNHVIQNPQVVKFLSTLEKAHEAILA